MHCTNCGSMSIDFDGAQAVCSACGVVLEESQIVSEITFGENSAGGAVVQGSYVGADQGRARTNGPGFRHGGTGESREQTLSNARYNINRMANAMKVSSHIADRAHRFFAVALAGGQDGEGKNFVQGRKSEYVVAACLYVACRMNKTNHMLIDFADIVQVNVFVLGRTYLRLIRQLHLQLPLIDPSFYISRFAALLEFGDETQRVALDASRLVARFKMDWMQEGRRPAGICGACLLLAARMNHFRRSISEIVQVVKIADVTLRKRLEEFKATPSGQLTVEDFRNVWLEEEYDPPAFYQAKLPKKEKRKNKVKREKGKKVKRDLDSALATDGLGGNDADAEDEQDDHEERNTKRVRRSVSPKGKGRTTSHRFETGPHQADDADNSIDAEDESVDQRPDPVLDPQLEVLADQGVEAEIGVYLAEDAARALDETLEQQERERRSRAIAGQVVPIAGTTTAPTSSAQDAKHASQEVIKQSQSTIRSMLSGDTVDDGTSDALAESPVTGVPPSLKNEGVTGDIEERVANDPLVGLDEAELDCFILNDDEVRIKERVWMEFNKDYLEILAAKQLKLEADQKAGIKPATKRKRNKPRDGSTAQGTSAAESTVQMMQKKKFSRKINYDVLKNLFSNDTKEPKSSRKKDGWDTDSSDDLRAGNNRSSNAGERDYFASDQDDNLEIIEEDAGLPPSHPLVRKESRPRGKKSGKGSGTDGRGSGRESGYESQTGAPLTGGATATEGEDEEFGRAEEGDGHGQNYFEEEDYADDYADGGDYWD